MQIHELNNFSGTLGAGSYLAIDNGTDTGRISSQGLLASTEARIDAANDQITDLKSAINGIAVKASASVNQNNPEYEDGVWADAQTWNASDSYRHSKYFISVETGDVIRFVTDNDINYKGLALYNGNTLVGVTSQNGDYPTDRARTYITIDGVGYFYYTYTIPSGINKISYQRKATIDGVADMVTINAEMPTTYTAYIEAYTMTNKFLGTHENISDFSDAAESVFDALNGKKVGFLGDSYTDVSYYYGAKIAEQTGMIAVANGKQGSRIFSDNSWMSGGQAVTALSFWHRVNLFTDNDFDAICIFGGINDASARSIYETNLGSITDAALTTEQVNNGAVPTTFYQAYKTVVEMLWEKYPTLPLLIIIPPHQLNASYNPSLTSYMGINAIRNAELSIAEYYGIPVCDLYKSCQELNNYSANVSEYRLSANDIHPNNKGQLAMARFIKQSLSELIK